MNDIRYHVRRTIILPNGRRSLPQLFPPRTLGGLRISPGWTEPDPERESWLDRAREHDEPPLEEEYEDHEPLTEEELAGIRERRPLMCCSRSGRPDPGGGARGSLARARVFPGESSSPAAGFGPGMVFDVLPGCAQLAVAADAAAGDDRFAGVSESELVGIMCAWDRVEAHVAARKLAVVAELSRRTPPRRTRSSPRTRLRTRWGSPGSAPVS